MVSAILSKYLFCTFFEASSLSLYWYISLSFSKINSPWVRSYNSLSWPFWCLKLLYFIFSSSLSRLLSPLFFRNKSSRNESFLYACFIWSKNCCLYNYLSRIWSQTWLLNVKFVNSEIRVCKVKWILWCSWLKRSTRFFIFFIKVSFCEENLYKTYMISFWSSALFAKKKV